MNQGHYIQVVPYKSGLYLFTDREAFAAFIKEHYNDETDTSTCQGQCVGYTDGCYAVGYFSGDIQILVHELAHVCFAIFTRIRTTAEQGNDEPFCYLLEYLTKECLAALKEKPSNTAPKRRPSRSNTASKRLKK